MAQLQEQFKQGATGAFFWIETQPCKLTVTLGWLPFTSHCKTYCETTLLVIMLQVAFLWSMWGHAYMYVWVHAHVEVRGQLQELFLRWYLLCFLSFGVSPNPGPHQLD